MAIDTKQKRRSSLHSLMPFFTPSVSIDGTMSQADRQESAWAYSGILAALILPGQILAYKFIGDTYALADIGDTYAIKDIGDTYAVGEE